GEAAVLESRCSPDQADHAIMVVISVLRTHTSLGYDVHRSEPAAIPPDLAVLAVTYGHRRTTARMDTDAYGCPRMIRDVRLDGRAAVQGSDRCLTTEST